MCYIVLNLMICAAYILFTGTLRSKYYQDIRHRGIELSSDILLCIVGVLCVGYVIFAQEWPSELQLTIYASMYAIELIALVYGICVMRSLTFEYKRQKKAAQCALFAAFVFAAIQAGNFYYHYL